MKIKNPCEHPLLRLKRLSKIQKLSHGDKMKRLRLFNACQKKRLKSWRKA